MRSSKLELDWSTMESVRISLPSSRLPGDGALARVWRFAQTSETVVNSSAV
jgi:hypothetical protein